MSIALTTPPRRVAVFGGNHDHRRWAAFGDVRVFRAPRLHGIGELRRLLVAIHAGSVDLVIVLTRWHGHAATRKVRAACRRRGIAFAVVR